MPLTFAPDLFDATRTNVHQDGKLLGYIMPEPGERFAATYDGSTRRFGTKAAAVAYLFDGGRLRTPPPTPIPANQFSLF